MVVFLSLVNVKILTAFPLPTEGPNISLPPPIIHFTVHKPCLYWFLGNKKLCELYLDANFNNEVHHIRFLFQLTHSSYQYDAEVHDALPKLQ
jgi:hypothetical protein